jgi:phage/plasmid-like protein (TIGR03299 family)
MLDAAHCNYDVVTTNVAAVDADGNMLYGSDGRPVIIKDSRATVRSNPDGSFRGISTVGTRYVVQQNREVLARAASVARIMQRQHKDETIRIDSCGAIGGGKEFFVTIRLGASIIDPKGIADQLDEYLVVRNGHDGKTPITFVNTPIRTACKNAVLVAVKGATRRITARHTKNADHVVNDGLAVARQWGDLSRKTRQIAEHMVRIDVKSNDVVATAARSILARSIGKKGQKHLDATVESIVSLYSGSLNSARYGKNGWSLYNAVVEYLDHEREADPNDRAETTMDLTSWVSKKKLATARYVLALTDHENVG